MKIISDNTCERYSFENISELYDFVSRDDNRHPRADSSSKSGDYGFTNTKSFDEAVELMMNGDTNLMDKIDVRNASTKSISEIVEGAKRSYVNDVVGFTPNVPLAVIGVPTNMIRSTKVPIKNKIINFAINVSVSGGVSAEDITRNAAILYAAIDSLERQGYRCNVWVVEAVTSDGTEYSWSVQVKTDKEPFNRLKMAFPLAHPSMLRRIGFAINERMGKWLGGGYGVPTHGEAARKQVDKMLDIKNLFYMDIMKLQHKGIKGIEEGAKSLVYEEYHQNN